MRRLPLPIYQIADVYSTCVNAVSDAGERESLSAETDRVLLRCAAYWLAASSGMLFTLPIQAAVQADGGLLKKLYDRYMTSVDGAARNVYLGIRNLSYLHRCPLCVQRDVSTLDHYLPKSLYPEFSVFPQNLVPCCLNCNKEKLAFVAGDAGDQLFHPYFDDWDDYVLLKAEVAIGEYVDVTFYIDEHASAPPLVIERAHAHFERLKLRELYFSHAASELESRKGKFQMDFDVGGITGVRTELQREVDSCSGEKNTWRFALYSALAANDPFCEGGFAFI